MDIYVKKFLEFINEEYKKTKADLKVDELWELSGHNQNKFVEIMKNYLEKNLNVEEFLEYYSKEMIDKLTYEIKNHNADAEYRDIEKDEDGELNGGINMEDIDSFEFNIDDDDKYGEFGINFIYFKSNDDENFHVFAFNDELDLTDTEIGKLIINSFDKIYSISFYAAEKNINADYKDIQDLKNTYKQISISNGWAH